MNRLRDHYEQDGSDSYDSTHPGCESSPSVVDNAINKEEHNAGQSALQTGKFKLRAAGYFLTANAVFRRKWIESLGPNDEAPPPLSVTMYDFMATPKTLLHDYTREKTLPEMSSDMKNVLKLFQQENEPKINVSETNSDHMLSEEAGIISYTSDENKRPENVCLLKGPVSSDCYEEHTRKKYQRQKRIMQLCSS